MPVDFKLIWDLLSDHQKWDVVYYFAFAGGQILFLLKRVSLAVRSPMNALKNRREYFYLNWDILTIRYVLEFALVYYPFRHVPMDSLFSMFGWNVPFHIPNSAISFLLLGYMSDSVMDWFAMQDKLMGIPIPAIVKETVPHLPEAQQLAKKLIEQKANGG